MKFKIAPMVGHLLSRLKKKHTLLYLEVPLPSYCHPCQRDTKKNSPWGKSLKESAGPLIHWNHPLQEMNTSKSPFFFVCFGVIQSQKSSFYRERHPSLSVSPKYILSFYFQRPSHERSRRFNRKDSHHQHFPDLFSTFDRFPFDSIFPWFTIKISSRRSPSPRSSKDHRETFQEPAPPTTDPEEANRKAKISYSGPVVLLVHRDKGWWTWPATCWYVDLILLCKTWFGNE